MPFIKITETKSRVTRPKKGDIFVYKLDAYSDRYYFGWVIDTDAIAGGFTHGILVYLYNLYEPTKHQIPTLDIKKLLIAPVTTGTFGWKQGSFEKVASIMPSQSDILSQHCFQDDKGRFRDEKGNLLSRGEGFVGIYGLMSPMGISKLLEKTLMSDSQSSQSAN